MRHSIPNKEDDYLSKDGIILAKSVLSKLTGLYDEVYSSQIPRAIQTAEIFSSNVRYELKERVIGDAKEDFWYKQYLDYDFKNSNGESLNESKDRMKSAIDDILYEMNEETSSLVVSHATAICSYLLNYCTLKVVNPDKKERIIIFKDKILNIGEFGYSSYFVLKFENSTLIDLDYYRSK